MRLEIMIQSLISRFVPAERRQERAVGGGWYGSEFRLK